MSVRFGALADLSLGLGSIRRFHRGRSGRVCRFADEEEAFWGRGSTDGQDTALPAAIIVPGEESSRGEGLNKIVR